MLRAVTRVAAPRVWNLQRKLIGNVLPVLCGTPFLAIAIWLWVRGLQWDAIAAAFASLATSAVSLNWVGLAGNAAMRRVLAARLKPNADGVFVGFSTPGYIDLLDPHEDLGFLQIDGEAVRITGERASFEILRGSELRLSYAFNPHALLGLGRWLVIQGTSAGRPIRILVEPRELRSLRSNRALGVKLRRQLEEWRPESNRRPSDNVAGPPSGVEEDRR